jgi:hypothetical protein
MPVMVMVMTMVMPVFVVSIGRKPATDEHF